MRNNRPKSTLCELKLFAQRWKKICTIKTSSRVKPFLKHLQYITLNITNDKWEEIGIPQCNVRQTILHLSNVLFSLCRILHSAETSQINSCQAKLSGFCCIRKWRIGHWQESTVKFWHDRRKHLHGFLSFQKIHFRSACSNFLSFAFIYRSCGGERPRYFHPILSLFLLQIHILRYIQLFFMKLLIKVQTYQCRYLKVVLSKFGRYFSGINLMLLIVFFFNCKATWQIVRNKIHLCKKLIR